MYVLDTSVAHPVYTPASEVQDTKPPKSGSKSKPTPKPCDCCGVVPCKYLPPTYVQARIKDSHSRTKLLTGDLRAWDVTALRIPFAGMLPPILKSDPAGHPRAFLEASLDKDQWKDQRAFKKAAENKTLKPKDAVQYAVNYCKNAIVSHTVMCQVTSTRSTQDSTSLEHTVTALDVKMKRLALECLQTTVL